jgi:hypothetical protein
VLPPLQLSVKNISDSFEVTKASSGVHDVASAGVRRVGLQGSGLLEETLMLAGPAWKPLPAPRRARKGAGAESLTTQPTKEDLFNSNLHTRWLRKRYQNLLGRVPTLTYSCKKPSADHRVAGRYEISLPPSALSSHIRYGAPRLPPVDDSNLSWVQHAQEADGNDGKSKSVMQIQRQDTITPNNASDNK